MTKKNIFFLAFFLINFGIIGLQTHHYALISIPKSGTYLLLKLLRLINGNKEASIQPKGWCLISDSILKVFFRNQRFLVAHALYIDENIKRLTNKNIKTFFIYRDPRDQIVSAAFFIKKPDTSWKLHSKWDINLLIDELIVNGGPIWGAVFGAKEIWMTIDTITSFYNMYLPWQSEPNVYTTTFEKLVGPQGGGNQDDLIHEIIAIAHHMGKHLTVQQATDLSHELFGSSITFREGQIGSWKKYFLPRHKEAFKKVAGQLLIDLGYEKDLNW